MHVQPVKWLIMYIKNIYFDWLRAVRFKGNSAKSIIERVSIECRKTKTKVNYFGQSKRTENPVNQSKLEVITRC